MKRYFMSMLLVFFLMPLVTKANVICNDGWVSSCIRSGPGCCSHHGGVSGNNTNSNYYNYYEDEDEAEEEYEDEDEEDYEDEDEEDYEDNEESDDDTDDSNLETILITLGIFGIFALPFIITSIKE